MHDTPFFQMFGRQPRLPVDIILGIPHVGRTADTEEFTPNTRDNLQIALHLARRNLTERADKQAEENSKIKPYPVFKKKNLDRRKYSCTDFTRIRMGPTQNWYYHGEDRMPSAHNFYQSCREYDSRTTPDRCQSTSPIQGPTINGRHHPHLKLRS